MPSTKRKVQYLLAVTTLLLLATAVGCRGFFVKPQLTTLTVSPPTAAIQLNTNLQMTATGTFDDGSRQTLTSGVFWSSSDSTDVPISVGGQITGMNIILTPVTITASAQGVSGTATVTVNPGNVTNITIVPSSQTISAPGGTTTYNCMASITGMPTIDVSSAVTWTVTDSTNAIAANITASQGTTPMTVTTTGSAVPGTYFVNATWTPNTTTFTATATLILN